MLQQNYEKNNVVTHIESVNDTDFPAAPTVHLIVFNNATAEAIKASNPDIKVSIFAKDAEFDFTAFGDGNNVFVHESAMPKKLELVQNGLLACNCNPILIKFPNTAPKTEGFDLLTYVKKALEPPKGKTPSAETKTNKLFRTFREITDNLVLKANYLIHGLMEKGTLVFVYGGATSGKTFFTLDVAVHVARGLPWRGKKTKKGKVLYICAEGVTGFNRRMLAQRRYYEWDDPEDNFIVIEEKITFTNDEDLTRIEIEIAELKQQGFEFALIIIDTLAQVSAGADENAAKEMSPILKRLESLIVPDVTSVLIIAHTGKDPKAGIRGTSIFKPAADTVIEVTDDDGIRNAEIVKAKDGEAKIRYSFGLEKYVLHEPDPEDFDDVEISTCIVVHHNVDLPCLTGKDAVLNQISQTPNKTQQELCSLLNGYDKGNMSVKIKMLLSDGYIAEAKSKGKGKGKSVEIRYSTSKDGQAYLDKLFCTKKKTAENSVSAEEMAELNAKL